MQPMQPMQPQMPGAMSQMGQQQPGNPQVVQQIPQSLAQPQERLDNISKVKMLIGPLRDSLSIEMQPMQPMQPQMPGAMSQMGQQQPGNPQVVQQIPQSLAQPQERLDNISKVKMLIGPLRDSLSLTLKSAAQILHQNYLVDVGPQKAVDVQPPRFDKSIEEFYSICDQMELHLKTSIECLNQLSSSQRYLPLPVATARTEPLPAQDVGSLTYPQYLATVRAQLGYTKEIHDVLLAAAQNIGMGE